MKFDIPSSPGTYALIMEAQKGEKIQVGKLGYFEVASGFYVYVGSAFGPGGLKARLNRHLKHDKKCRWHIDYLRKYLNVVDIWHTTSPEKKECLWAQDFIKKGGRIHFKGFGSSDCKCQSHLFFFADKPEQNNLLGLKR